jgi:hypothetical protein
VAADLTSPTSDAMPAPPPAIPSPSASHAHRVRFAVVYGALGAILIAAVVGVVIFASRSVNPAAKWSAWKPSGGGQGAAQQIADYVGPAYHLPNGDQLVDVISRPPTITPAKVTLPVHFVAVRGTKTLRGYHYALSPGNTIVYSMCGLGAACAIATGQPSQARGELVRREILELALYTFKYVNGVDNVIAFMPPTSAKAQKFVVYLRRDDVASELKQPLATTLGDKVPLPATIPAREIKAIDHTTTPRLYDFNGIAQSQQGDLIFVFAPIPAA